MTLPMLEKMIISVDSSLRDAMKIIDINAQGICFVTKENFLCGVLSDGDIRRALLKGINLEEKVVHVMQKNFVALPVNSPLEKIHSLLSDRIKHIPVVNDEGLLVDYVCSARYHQISLTQPVLDGNEIEYVTDCLRTGWISSQGKYVRMFEEMFGEYVGNNNSLAVSNGTVALHLALVSLGVGQGDEVIVPDLTFAAPVNAILYVGAKPVLVDIDDKTLSIDTDLIESAITKKTKAIIPVHLYGHPCNLDKIMRIAKKYNLFVIEDCAEALGSFYQGKHVGNYGDASIFSFFGNKTITTGEGGMLIFRDKKILEHARILRDHGMSRERRYWHDFVGFNYRMTNIQAAIGVAQVERVAEFVSHKRRIAEKYTSYLSSINEIELPGEYGDVLNSYWLYTIILSNNLSANRNNILNYLQANGIEVRPVFYPMHLMPPYVQFGLEKESYSVSKRISDGGISLPSAVTMSDFDIERVSHILKTAIKKYSVY